MRLFRVRELWVGLVVAGVIGWTLGAGAQPMRPDPRTGLIVGQVVDAASGKPVAGAIVSIGGLQPVRSGIDIPLTTPSRILTGSDGRFLFRDLPRGNFNIIATKAGYAEGAFGRRRPLGPSHRVTLEEGERVGDVLVPMWKTGSISGIVVDESGEIMVAVQIRAFRRTVVSGRRTYVNAGTALTDDRGIYRFGSLTPGEYVVAAAPRHVVIPISLTQDARTAAAASARTMGGGLPLPGSAGAIQVGDLLYGLGRGNATPPPPANDRLSIYPYTFHPAGRSFTDATPVAVASGQDRTAIDLQMEPVPTIRVSGMVVGPDGPMTMQPIRLMPDDPDAIAVELDAPATTTDLGGAFVLGAIPEGRYTLRAISRVREAPEPISRHQPDPLLWADIPVSAGEEDIEGFPVVLRHGLRVNGRFEFQGSGRKPSAHELTQIAIAVEAAEGVPVQAGALLIDPASGEFTTSGVPAGLYLVRVTASPVGWMFKSASYAGRDISLSPIEISSGDLSDVVLQFTDRWSGVQGFVTTTKGASDPNAAVLLFPADAGSWTSYGRNPRRLRSARPDSNGGYVINSVPPGDYYVAAVPEEQSGDWQDPAFLELLTKTAARVSVGEGEKKNVDLRTRDVR